MRKARAKGTPDSCAFFTVPQYADCEADGSVSTNIFNEIGNDDDDQTVVRELEQRCAHLAAELAAEKRSGSQEAQHNNVCVLCWGQVLLIKDDRTLLRQELSLIHISEPTRPY